MGFQAFSHQPERGLPVSVDLQESVDTIDNPDLEVFLSASVDILQIGPYPEWDQARL